MTSLVGMKFKINFVLSFLLLITLSFIFIQLNKNSLIGRDLVHFVQSLSLAHFHILYGESKGRVSRKNPVLVKMAAYNEEANIGDVLARMPKDVDVLVIDDCSMDKTSDISQEHGAMIIRHVKNLGQGVADLTGFMMAFELGYEIIIEMDADGQHNPEDIPRFIKAFKDNPSVDIVVGSRILGSQDNKGASKLRTYFLPYYTRVINWASGYLLTDALCGYKAYRSASLQPICHVLNTLSETEYIAAEMYIRFGRLGLSVNEIPIHVDSRNHGTSHKGTFRYGVAVAWIIFRTAIFNRFFQMDPPKDNNK